ncbi:signal peptidase II [Actinoalloteichus spitiensis]|uniref:signal peptidase II n=1 Tax=Actinoalloteichus spitiensis TaxID=252394 RepID=UPI000365A9CE|nr:signal peptidase II [Actinoalloteichus spitiensis]
MSAADATDTAGGTGGADPAPAVTGPAVRTGAVLVAVTVVLGIALDQLTKWWALDALGDGTVIPLLPTTSFRLVFNPGVAFGMGSEIGPALTVVLIGVVLFLIGWLVTHVRRREGLANQLLLAVVVAGACGNLADRLFRAEDGPLTGHVVDFIAVDWFAVFNVADIFTTCGVLAFAVLVFWQEGRRPTDGEAEGDDTTGTGTAAQDDAGGTPAAATPAPGEERPTPGGPASTG